MFRWVGEAVGAALVVGGWSVAADAKAAGPTLAVSAERSSYTGGHGTKSMVSARAAVPLGRGYTVTVDAAAGERRLKGHAHRAHGLGVTLQTELAHGIISRTQLARGDAGPLFAKIAVGEELALALGKGEIRAAGRVSRYAGEVDVRSFHTGLS